MRLVIPLVLSFFAGMSAIAGEVRVSSRFTDFPELGLKKFIDDQVSSQDNRGIFLCFDNRLITSGNAEYLFFDFSQKPRREQYCEVSEGRTDIGFFRNLHNKRHDFISNGVLISRMKNNNIVCEAVFTQNSAHNVLNMFKEKKEEGTLLFEPQPYGEFLPEYYRSYGGKIEDIIEGSNKYYNIERDEIIKITNDFDRGSCSSELFKKYWKVAAEQCVKGVNILRAEQNAESIYYRITHLRSELLSSYSKTCNIY
ncbi:hypothetical protein ACQU0X_21135 [Pseudovibrio ascidiaceicola]|uniref:hypothetical protein n=1 Tax=Pseudovibrio ascidiaceicola TaxID=285279 RepID=UPI003D35B7B0